MYLKGKDIISAVNELKIIEEFAEKAIKEVENERRKK